MENNYLINLNDENFDSIVLNNNKIVVVDFWAEWCHPCKIFIPILENIARKYKDRIIVSKINIDNFQNIVEKYDIQSVPTLIIFHNKKILSRHTGVLSQIEMKKILNGYLNI